MSPSPKPPRTLAFVSCSSTQEIVVFDFDRISGALTELSRHVVPSVGEQMSGSLPFVLSADRRFLFASLRQTPFPTVSFSVRAEDGALTPLGSSTVIERPAELICDHAGRHVFTVSYSGHILSVSPIGADGVAGATTQVIRTPPQAHGVVIDPTDRHVYIACMAEDVVLGYRFDARTGKLDETPFETQRSAAGAGPRHLAFGRDAGWLYAITEHHGTVIAFQRDAGSGRLTPIQTVSMLPDGIMNPAFTPVPRPPPGAADIHVSADGGLLFASDRPTHTIGGFRIDKITGRLDPIGNVPAEQTPRSFAIDSAGGHLLCIGADSGTVGVYVIDAATGALTRRSATKVESTVDWIELADMA
jgi:6-phosphogluconolactonase